MSVIAREQATYEGAWAIAHYADHSPGEHRVSVFREMAGISRAWDVTVLDAGCGSGKGAVALAALGCDVRMCDITPNGLIEEAQRLPFHQVCLWHPLERALGYVRGGKVDYVYCCDVLEHIPTEFTMLVIARLLEVARRGVFLSIALVPDHFGVWVGKPLHQTVKPFTWWRDNLNALGTVQEARDCMENGLFYVVPR